MIDLRRLLLVAAFELRDALRARLVVFLVALFAAGAGLGTWGFLSALRVAEAQARELMADQLGVSQGIIEMNEIRETALTGLFSMVQNPELRGSLLAQEPLSLFFGYVSLLGVPLLVLLLSAGSHSADIQAGSVRFALFRCDRTTWALGKTVGHAALLAVGLMVAAGVAAAVNSYLGGGVYPEVWMQLFLAALRTWVYGLAYLGLFVGLSLLIQAKIAAQALCFFAMLGLAIGHAVVSSESLREALPAVQFLAWLFPAQYKLQLWLLTPLPFLLATVALLSIGAGGFALGARLFAGRDA